MNQPTTVYDYLRLQPEDLDAILDRREELTAAFARLFQATGPDRLYLVGSGTSLNAAQAAAPLMETVLGIEVIAREASALAPLWGSRPLVMLLSHQGTSTNTLAALDRLRANPHIAVTIDAGSELERHAAHHMLVGARRETVGPKTIGYTATVLSLYLAAIAAAGTTGRLGETEHAAYVDTLRLSVDQMRLNIDDADLWWGQFGPHLANAEYYALVGRGPGHAPAVEGGLKILETVRRPTMSYSFEEYLHGPALAADSGLAALVFVTDDDIDKPRMLALAEFHESLGAQSYRVTADRSVTERGTFHIATTGLPYTQVFEYVVLPQLIAAMLPDYLGIPSGDTVFRQLARRLVTKAGADM